MAPKGKAKPKGAKSDDSGSDLKVANHLKLRHILCEKQSKIQEALAELQEGAKFDQVATKYSEDKARQGGSLGWMNRSGMVGPFQDVCFKIPVSTPAKPIYREITTSHGFHIVMVEDRKI